MGKSLEGYNNLALVIFMGKIRAERTYFLLHMLLNCLNLRACIFLCN